MRCCETGGGGVGGNGGGVGGNGGGVGGNGGGNSGGSDNMTVLVLRGW